MGAARALAVALVAWALAAAAGAAVCVGSTPLANGQAVALALNPSVPLFFELTPGTADTSFSVLVTWQGSVNATLYAAPWCGPSSLSFVYANASAASASAVALLFPVTAPAATWEFALVVAPGPDAPPAQVQATATSLSACPNACSGHGTCGAGVCLCDAPYEGAASDCSVFSLAAGAVVAAASPALAALPPPALLVYTGTTAYTVSLTVTATSGGLVLLGAGRVPVLGAYDAFYALNASAAPVQLLYAPPDPSRALYVALLSPPAAPAPLPFVVAAAGAWLCPNNCSGQGTCHAYGCACNTPYTAQADCSLFDLNLANNASASAAVPALTWVYFHIGVTDATQLEWDVVATDPACAPALQVYAMQNARPVDTSYDYRSYSVESERRLSITLGGPRAGEPSVWWLGLYSPVDCDVIVNAAATRTCPNDCSENGLCQAGTCVCVPPFTLDDCSATDVELYADLPVSAAVSADQLAYFHTQVLGDDALYIRAEELVTQGAVILLAHLGSYPTASLFTYRNDSPAALHEILIPSTQAAGIWYVALLGAASLAPPTTLAQVHLSVSEGCAAYATCGQCIADPNCGWCSTDVLSAVQGACVSGSNTEPYSASCEAYLFDTCSTDASRRRTTFFGLLLGVGLGSLLIVAISAIAFVIYQHWHRSFKEALSGRPDRQ